jgi:hypothetical protein
MTNKKTLMIIYGFIIWPIFNATTQFVSANLYPKLYVLDINFYVIVGVFSGLLAAVIFLGFSWVISRIIKKFTESSTITTPIIFFIISCLATIQWLRYVMKTSSVLFG